MLKNLLLGIIILSVSFAHGQFIDEVLEYTPAPGQLTNDPVWGIPSAAHSVIGGTTGHISLGAFGGYIVFKFDQPVDNNPENPFGVDFTIFGNPLNDWSEPACVWVMNDENQNSEADDTWYLLAGSDYYFSNSVINYEVTYTNPNSTSAADVEWTDNLGNSGVIPANEVHTQPYYPQTDSFPGIDENSYTLSGLRIDPVIDETNPGQINLYKRTFGFVDNQFRGTAPFTLPDNPYTEEVENSGGDAFDISWAVDENGNYIELDQIDFVKVQNSVMDVAGWLGEISTEITGAVDVEPDNSISGATKCIAIKDLPAPIDTNEVQLEAISFNHGKPFEGTVNWTTSSNEIWIDEANVLHSETSGEFEITATLNDDPSVSKTITVKIDLNTGIQETPMDLVQVYPNPSNGGFKIKGAEDVSVTIFNQMGQVVFQTQKYTDTENINISDEPNGLYVAKISSGKHCRIIKTIKQK